MKQQKHGFKSIFNSVIGLLLIVVFPLIVSCENDIEKINSFSDEKKHLSESVMRLRLHTPIQVY
ncbi:MAG: hypothetical protein HC906_01700 [Bacteroidales bacterium]|nr:hypothetical protein [Bacteroidales bacterium]